MFASEMIGIDIAEIEVELRNPHLDVGVRRLLELGKKTLEEIRDMCLSVGEHDLEPWIKDDPWEESGW